MNKKIIPAALPFIQWAGGKRSMIPFLARFIPDKIKTYREPFIGGGAIFFAFSNRIEKAHLSDTNKDLINTYKIVQKKVEPLIKLLGKHQKNHHARSGKTYMDGNTYYQRIRQQIPTCRIERAARFIYLNKTCYNALYRVNSSGKFNVPQGRKTNPDICNPARLRSSSKALKKATIKVADFKETKPDQGDFIYCDPPFDGCFTAYQANGFDSSEQDRLHTIAQQWDNAGATIILSNANTKNMRKLYKDWNIKRGKARRSISQDVKTRILTTELIVMN